MIKRVENEKGETESLVENKSRVHRHVHVEYVMCETTCMLMKECALTQ